MKKMWNKTIAMLLVVIMIGGAAPLGALAEMEFPTLPSGAQLSLFTDGFNAVKSAVTWISKHFYALSLRASATAYSGNCGANGDDVAWSFDTETGELSITGTGDIADYYDGHTSAPWHSYRSSVKIVTIGNGVTGIGYGVFYCTKMISITIPDSVTKIGDFAFSGCSNLLSAIIPNTIMSIGDSTFYLCSALTNVTIPDSVTNIGASAFDGCKNLTSITIPSNITNIGNRAFANCTKITSVNIPDSAVKIGEDAFRGCESLESVEFNAINCSLMGGESNSAFSGCSSIRTVSIGENVATIPAYLFDGCLNLTQVAFPDSVTSIGRCSFRNCGITKVTLSDNVKEIGYAAFRGCNQIEEMSLPFVGLSPNAKNYNSVFGAIFGYDSTDTTSTVLQYYATNSWHRYFIPTSLRSVRITNCDSLPYGAFYNCTMLTEIHLPKDLSHIGANAFYNTKFYNNTENWINGILFVDGIMICASPNYKGKYTIPDGMKCIPDSAFSNCKNLTGVTIPQSVTSIGKTAFSSCISIREIVIPESISFIGENAFSNCDGLQKVYYLGNLAQWCQIEFQSGYIGYNSNPLSSAHRLYIDNKLLTEALIPEGVSRISAGAFYSCTSLQSVWIPNGILNIDESTFYHCSGLTELTIADTVTGINSMAFYECSNLNSLTLPDALTGIGGFAFSGCTKLKNIVIPDNVKGVSWKAFKGCTSLESVVLPSGLTRIQEETFSGCTKLSNITMPKNVQMIEKKAFSDCNRLKTVCYDGTSEQWVNSVTIEDGNTILLSANWYYHAHTNETETQCINSIEATCTQNGYSGDSLYIPCGSLKQKGEVIPALGHTYRTEITVPTCEASGYTTFICTRCGNSYMDDIVDATGHDYMVTKHKDATCTENGYDIYNCKHDPTHTYTEMILAKGHDYKTETVAPTCEAKGYTTHTCSRCKDNYVTDEKVAIGHAWDSGRITKVATCTEDGVRAFTCTHDSSHTRTESIPATGHSFGAWTQTKAPTVYADGEKTQTCYKCGTKNTQSIPKLPMPTVTIRNFTTSSNAYDYRSTITFRADVENSITGGQIHWFVDGKDVFTGDVYTIKEAKNSFEIQVKYIDGSNTLSQTEIEKVNVKTGFFAKLKAFFRALFGRLPKVVQEYLGVEIIDRVIPD